MASSHSDRPVQNYEGTRRKKVMWDPQACRGPVDCLEIHVSSMRDTPYPIHNAARFDNFGLVPRLSSGSHCNRIMLGPPE